MLRIYTDGACSTNTGKGGWAWAVQGESTRFNSGHVSETTNQRMELTAALEAVLSNPGELTIVSDSAYVVNCFRDFWYVKWLQNDWHKSSNPKSKLIMNRDLWEPLIEVATSRKIRVEWVKGHSGDPMNDLVDRLAVAAAKSSKIS
jgi:ribonuclease HI